jgi:hypothetical protein
MKTLKHLSLTSSLVYVFAIVTAQQPANNQATPAMPPRASMKLTIPAVPDGSHLPEKFSCAAGATALRPELQWTNAPASTVSFVILLHDAEGHPAKGAYDVTHWLVWNIPATTTQLPEASPKADLPGDSIVGANTASRPPEWALKANEAPPCAPHGNLHHYSMELYAVDQKLQLPATATRADVMKALDGHIIGTSVSTWVFTLP